MQMIGGRRRFKKFANFPCFTDFCCDGGSLALGMLWNVSFTNREVVLCRKNDMKQALKRKIYQRWGSDGREAK